MQARDQNGMKSKNRIEDESLKADKSNNKVKLGLMQVSFFSFYNLSYFRPKST